MRGGRLHRRLFLPLTLTLSPLNEWGEGNIFLTVLARLRRGKQLHCRAFGVGCESIDRINFVANAPQCELETWSDSHSKLE